MQRQDTTARPAGAHSIIVRVPQDPPELNAKAARTLLKILLAVAESDRELDAARDRAA